MGGCSIRKCKSRSVKGGSIKFFSFPTKESVANEWLRYCGSKTTTKNGRVCSNHFLQSDYIRPPHQVLLDYAPQKVRQLKPDAIPTLQIDSTDTENTLDMSTEEISEIVCTPDNITQYDTSPVNEVAESSKVVEKSDETISDSVAEYEQSKGTANELNDASDNRKCLSQCNTEPANEVAGSYKAVKNSALINSLPVSGQPCTFYIYSTVPANEVEESCTTVVEKSDKTISVSVAEYKSLKRTAAEFHVLKDNLEKIFTPGQIRCLMTADRHRINWSAEDIAAATVLRSISLRAYRHLKDTIGIPLPSLSTLRHTKFK